MLGRRELVPLGFNEFVSPAEVFMNTKCIGARRRIAYSSVCVKWTSLRADGPFFMCELHSKGGSMIGTGTKRNHCRRVS